MYALLVQPPYAPKIFRQTSNGSTHPPTHPIKLSIILLCDWYAQCIGVCIPLTVMQTTHVVTPTFWKPYKGSPVLMTHSGCLPLTPKRGCGLWVRPQDCKDWRIKMNLLVEKRQLAAEMGDKGRKIREKFFSVIF